MHSIKIALLAASGVSEIEMTAIQRILASNKIRAVVVSPESGLIHSWADSVWGHCYPVDAKLETSLGSDFDGLILPGGRRHVDKLMTNPHTKRFVSAFFLTKKPVAAFGESEEIVTANALAGDNLSVLRYDSADALNEACASMIAHLDQASADPVSQAA